MFQLFSLNNYNNVLPFYFPVLLLTTYSSDAEIWVSNHQRLAVYKDNNDQSNLAKAGITPCLYTPGGHIGLAIACFG